MNTYSLIDNDLYKFSMMQTALHQFATHDVEYKFICRSKVDLRPFKHKIEKELDELCKVKVTPQELKFLSTIRFLKKDYIDFLEDFTLKRRYITVTEENDQLSIRIKGPWVQTILFEVPVLAIIAQIYGESQGDNQEILKVGRDNLQKKIAYFKTLEDPFYFTEFGTRRRFSREWQDEVVKTLKQEVGSYLLGTSNVYLAMKYDLKVSGTMAHEFLMMGQGLKETQLVNSQKYMLESWAKEYRGDLGIALTDTIGIDSFMKDFDLYLAKLYDGVRHDSGDPKWWGDKMINHYKSFNIDPMSKSLFFSDNLNFNSANEINTYFKDRAKKAFGIGTFLTNDMGFKALSMVIKLVRVEGNAVAKLSDEPSKEICEDDGFLSYLKKVFNKPSGGSHE